MYLDTWMIVTIILAFGICASYNRKTGYRDGGAKVLLALHNMKVIQVTEKGEIRKVN